MLHGCRYPGFRRLLAALFALATQGAFADAEFDIRAASPLGSAGSASDYVLAVTDCRQLAEVSIVATAQRLLPIDATRESDVPNSCSFTFRIDGVSALQPAVQLKFADGTQRDYSETFQQERQSPELELTQLAIESSDGGQFLVASFDAADDVDLSYVSFTLTGLRASDLRAAGGVVSRAEATAFLRMPQGARVSAWPPWPMVSSLITCPTR